MNYLFVNYFITLFKRNNNNTNSWETLGTTTWVTSTSWFSFLYIKLNDFPNAILDLILCQNSIWIMISNICGSDALNNLWKKTLKGDN